MSDAKTAETDASEPVASPPAPSLEELRAKHGSIEVLELPREGQAPAIVAIKAMALDDFLELQHNVEKRQSGVRLKDPRELIGPLLSCVVLGFAEAQQELSDFPGFEYDLLTAVSRLAGAMRDDVDVSLTEEPRPKQPIKIQVAGHVLTFRRLDAFDYSNARADMGRLSRDCPGVVSPIALYQIAKRQIVKEEAAEFDRVMALWPAAAKPVGLLLYGAAQSAAERRAGK